MRGRIAVVLTVLTLIVLVMAAPVGAEKPLRGPVDGYFNTGFGDIDTPCAHITWAGTVELGGEEFGIAWMPLAPPKEVGRAFHVEERWLIYSSTFEFEGGVFTECGDELGMWGDEKAVESFANLHAVANGQVDWVNPDGPFGEALEGRNSHWSGVVAGSLDYFEGTFRINQ